jgi:hypothetical protein
MTTGPEFGARPINAGRSLCLDDKRGHVTVAVIGPIPGIAAKRWLAAFARCHINEFAGIGVVEIRRLKQL